MLEVLRIKNLAVIDAAEISFKTGLNILSGETGAGKSIVLEAIGLILGSRASTDLIRSGCDEAVVEGIFDISELGWIHTRLENLGFQSDFTSLLIKRTVHRTGKHRITINGELSTTATLHKLCDGLIDLCSQHEHQSLTKPTVQLDLLDRYAGLQSQRDTYIQAYDALKLLNDKLKNLIGSQSENAKQKDFISYQIQELEKAELQIGEDEELVHIKNKLTTSEVRIQHSQSALNLLESDEAGVLNNIKSAFQRLKSLSAYEPEISSEVQSHLQTAREQIEEACFKLSKYNSTIELDPTRLEVIQHRLGLISDLKRKYGTTIQSIIETLAKLKLGAEQMESFEIILKELNVDIDMQIKILKTVAKALSSKRILASELFSKSVGAELKDLRMSDANLLLHFAPIEQIDNWTRNGSDHFEWKVITNRGEEPKSLSKIASGGELSRLMLAIRRVIADKGGIGVYLFDEIDAGIGGQTAFQVGKKLKSVASHNQVICITHLPQVAAFADHHLNVIKENQGKRTITQILELKGKNRQEEIARMLTGETLSKKNLDNALELIEQARA